MRNWIGKHVDTNEAKKWTPDRKKITVVYQVPCKDCHQHRTLPHPRCTTSSTVLTRRQLVVCVHNILHWFGLVFGCQCCACTHKSGMDCRHHNSFACHPSLQGCPHQDLHNGQQQVHPKYILSHITSKHCNYIYSKYKKTVWTVWLVRTHLVHHEDDAILFEAASCTVSLGLVVKGRIYAINVMVIWANGIQVDVNILRHVLSSKHFHWSKWLSCMYIDKFPKFRKNLQRLYESKVSAWNQEQDCIIQVSHQTPETSYKCVLSVLVLITWPSANEKMKRCHLLVQTMFYVKIS